jgi:hypothetical protein
MMTKTEVMSVKYDKAVVAAGLLVALFIVPVYASSFEDLEPSGRGRALGGAYTTIVNDPSANWWNPAGLSEAQGKQLSVFYQDLFGLGLVSDQYFGYIQQNVKGGGVALTWNQVSTSSKVDFMKYSENSYSFGYGYGIVPQVSAGISLTYYNLTQPLRATGFGCSAGLLIKLFSDHIRLAAVGNNLNRPTITWYSGRNECLPSKFTLGLGIKPGKSWTLLSDFRNIGSDFTEVHIGAETKFFSNKLSLRCGVCNLEKKRWLPSCGAGVKWGMVKFDYACEFHYALGTSQTLALALNW